MNDTKPIKNLTGRVFGRWAVLSQQQSHGYNHRWLCRCECGAERVVFGNSLRKGTSKSCGCLQKDQMAAVAWTDEKNVACQKSYRSRNRDILREQLKLYRKKNPVSTAVLHRKHYYRSRYGIEVEDAEKLLKGQGGVCAICGMGIKLGGKHGAKVDHDHATEKVRGVLCSRCNTGLGHFRDNPETLAAAILYLQRKP